MKKINILAVNDPAVYAYIDETKGFLKEIEKELNIDINFEVFPFEKYYDQLMEAFENHFYDIVMVAGHLWLSSFVQKGYLLPIGSKEEVEVDQDIIKSISEEMFYKGQQYLMPSFCDGHLLTYRKSVLRKELPASISVSQVLEEVQHLESAQSMTPIVLKAHPSELFLDILPYLRAEGCEPFSEDGKPQINTINCKKGIEKYMSLASYGPIVLSLYDNDRVREAIQKKKCVFAVTWGGQMGAVMDERCIDSDDIGFAALKESWNVTWSFGINNMTENNSLAIEVMKRLTVPKIDREVGKICGNPTRLSNFEADKDIYSWYPLAKEMITTARPIPSFPLLADFIGIMTEALDGIVHQDMPIDKTLEKAQDKMMQLL